MGNVLLSGMPIPTFLCKGLHKKINKKNLNRKFKFYSCVSLYSEYDALIYKKEAFFNHNHLIIDINLLLLNLSTIKKNHSFLSGLALSIV